VIPVVLPPAAGTPAPSNVIETTEQLHQEISDFNNRVRIVRLVPPSEASRMTKRPLTTIAGELRQANEELARAEELSAAADKAQRAAAHARVDALRRVTRLRFELQNTAEGRSMPAQL
jgi:hypothetical protein